MRALKPNLAPEFTSNNLPNIDDGLVSTDSILSDDQITDEFIMNDDGNDDEDCSGDDE